jgi:transcriptional regulator with XRE-family HTH domain
MAIGEVIREARVQLGITQEDVGGIAYISPKTVSAIECGRRRIAPEVLGELVRRLDHPRLSMEAAAEVTGGAYSTPWLDGEGVDLHRVSVWAKALEELQEAAAAVGATKLVNKPERASEAERAQVHESLMQVLDARVAVDHYVAIICQEFGLSVTAVYQSHKSKLEQRGYIRKKKRAAR